MTWELNSGYVRVVDEEHNPLVSCVSSSLKSCCSVSELGGFYVIDKTTSPEDIAQLLDELTVLKGGAIATVRTPASDPWVTGFDLAKTWKLLTRYESKYGDSNGEICVYWRDGDEKKCKV